MDAKDWDFHERCAVAAMVALVTKFEEEHQASDEYRVVLASVARRAFDYADAMLKESHRRSAERAGQ